MSAQFFGRSGKVLYGAFSIVGMAYQSQNVNNGIPDDRVARSMLQSTCDTVTLEQFLVPLKLLQWIKQYVGYIILYCFIHFCTSK